LNDKPVKNWDAFRTKIASFKPKDVVELNILRDGKPRSLEVIIGERPSDQQMTMNAAPLDLDEDLGFSVRSLTESLRNELRLSEDLKGVVVQSLKESSEAYERGLRNGDIISAVKRKDISSAQEFYDAVQKSLDEGDRALLLTVERDNLKQFIAFRL
jgi:serine protease Do